MNSVTFIGKVIRHAKLTPDQVKIVCSQSGESYDLFDKAGRVYIVSDGTATHSILDVSTTIRQIAGRIRDTRYKEITHIFSESRYGRDVSYAQFKASTEKEIDKAERFLKWYATGDEDVKSTIQTDMDYINKKTMTLDNNRLKLDMLNFRN